MIVGLSGALPASLYHGLSAHGVPRPEAAHVAHLPPVSTLFAAFLGYSPLEHLLPAQVLHHLTRAQFRAIVGRSFFPSLIASPFGSGLHTAFDFAAAGCLVAALASWARGKRYVYSERRAVRAGETLVAPETAPAGTDAPVAGRSLGVGPGVGP